MHKLIVMSDLHLVPEGELSFGIDTFARAMAAVARINSDHPDAEAVVFAGDIADHGSAAAYQRFAIMRSALRVPMVVTLGNHDALDTYLTAFPGEENTATGKLDHVIDLPSHRVIVLDSHVAGSAEGAISTEQLTWLDTQLLAAADRALAVVLHHNPASLGIRTDAIQLRDPEALFDVLKRHKRVDHILSGHVHLTASGAIHGIPFSTLSGNHFSVAPTLSSCPRLETFSEVFLEGPAQFAVMLFDDVGVRIHFENYDDRHRALPIAMFKHILIQP